MTRLSYCTSITMVNREGGGGKHTSNKYRTKKDELKRKRNAKRSRNRTDSDTLADINDM